jgi:photosystem II stability/assembly factor-like uncharacterized protein
MTRTWQWILGFLACALLAGCGSLVEFPPLGGRTHAISVSPTDRDHIVIANEFGGLWKTQNGGRSWRHLGSLPAVPAFDVQFGSNGRTLVATLGADGRRANRGGIWLSRDGGDSWTRPVHGAVPSAGIGPAGAHAWGISVAPDETQRWYVGTDSGVARSKDNGESWEHVGVDRGLPPEMAVDRRGAVHSVLALPDGVVLAMLGNGIHRSSDHGLGWEKILEGDFTVIDNPGFNKMDRSPDGRLAFILKDYWTLLVYDPSTGSFTKVSLASKADSNTKGPFVRISRPATGGRAPPTALTIWIGQGFVTQFATVSNPDAIAVLRPGDWTAIGRAEGIHAAAGDLGVSGDFQPVMLGTDGGVFKPAPGTLLRWESAAAYASDRRRPAPARP